MLSKLQAFLARERASWRQKREIQTLGAEVRELRAQNARMKAGMRRCLTCEYRLESEARRAEPPASA